MWAVVVGSRKAWEMEMELGEGSWGLEACPKTVEARANLNPHAATNHRRSTPIRLPFIVPALIRAAVLKSI